MKTLSQLYISAGEAAIKALDLKGMAAHSAKVEAFKASGVEPADEQVWEGYYDEQLRRLQMLSCEPSPSERLKK